MSNQAKRKRKNELQPPVSVTPQTNGQSRRTNLGTRQP
jgi:hypothetical protein